MASSVSIEKTESQMWCLSAQVKTSQVDEISFALWELGILGIQECPLGAELYKPQKGTEFREPQNPADWTTDEKLILEDKTQLKIFLAPEAQQVVKDFLNQSGIEIDSLEELQPESFLENYKIQFF